MKTQLTKLFSALVVLAGLLCHTHAAQIIWIVQEDGPAGVEFVEMLRTEGHDVEIMVVADEPPTGDQQATMNAADLVVVSRKVNSGNGAYNTFVWNDTITTPLISHSPYILRTNDTERWQWMEGTGLADATPSPVEANQPDHKIFEGLTLTDGISSDWHFAIDRNTSVSTDAVAKGGKAIATKTDGPPGAIIVAEWETGQVAVGPRMMFMIGAREPSENQGIGADYGRFNLTEAGQIAFLNSISYYAGPWGASHLWATFGKDLGDRPIAPAVAFMDLGHAEEDHGDEGEHHMELMELQGFGGVQPVPAEEGAPTAYPLPGADHGLYADAHEGPRWGMAIDLDKCTGCSACVVACHSENNVPWVGEEQVVMGRDMTWMRIERYYEHVDATHASHLDVRFLPMLCQHCGNAPCEPVCPVYATYHTPEGVNAQIYNRCVGTRYCANNCPYKVRVYNWYRYTDENVPEPMNWQWNPDVTVRTNGIMEKCSFCMQRIKDAENRAALEEGREVRDGEIVPACQQSCPAEAIVFGNLRDPEARVSQIIENERTYRVLDELINTQPAVNYLKKVTFHEVSGGH